MKVSNGLVVQRHFLSAKLPNKIIWPMLWILKQWSGFSCKRSTCCSFFLPISLKLVWSAVKSMIEIALEISTAGTWNIFWTLKRFGRVKLHVPYSNHTMIGNSLQEQEHVILSWRKSLRLTASYAWPIWQIAWKGRTTSKSERLLHPASITHSMETGSESEFSTSFYLFWKLIAWLFSIFWLLQKFSVANILVQFRVDLNGIWKEYNVGLLDITVLLFSKLGNNP